MRVLYLAAAILACAEAVSAQVELPPEQDVVLLGQYPIPETDFVVAKGVRVLTEDQVETIDVIVSTSPEGLTCLLYTSPSPRDKRQSRMPSSA